MPRVQDAIPSLDCRAWKGCSNPLFLSGCASLRNPGAALALNPHGLIPQSFRLAASPKLSRGAPGNIRRAEEFIRSNAHEAITVESIAQAAGCSIRALQLGFRRF